MDNLFTELNAINVNNHTEKKKAGSTELTYLSWAWAWGEFKKICPNATYEIKRFGNNEPYFYDENLGYMVFTSVTVDNLTYEMWLPVMDSANKAMKKEPYTYQVKEYSYGKATGKMIDKTCDAATMFDINKTIMRCLVKNLAMFGLGLYIYAGEDLPEEDKENADEFKKQAAAAKAANTKAVKQAVANDEEMPHRIYNTPLQERYELCLQWLKEQTPATYINAAKGKKDWCNDVARELREQNLTEQLDTFMDAFDKATSIDDNVNI